MNSARALIFYKVASLGHGHSTLFTPCPWGYKSGHTQGAKFIIQP